MTRSSRPDSAPEFDRFLQIALDEGSERNMRLAAEALVSAILNGASEFRAEAVEILLEENELRAAETVARILDDNRLRN